MHTVTCAVTLTTHAHKYIDIHTHAAHALMYCVTRIGRESIGCPALSVLCGVCALCRVNVILRRRF